MSTTLQKPSYRESAFVMISCEDECDASIDGVLQSISEIKEIQHTTGRYDVIVKIESQSTESLREIISLKIRKIPKVRATTTLISSPILVF